MGWKKIKKVRAVSEEGSVGLIKQSRLVEKMVRVNTILEGEKTLQKPKRHRKRKIFKNSNLKLYN